MLCAKFPCACCCSNMDYSREIEPYMLPLLGQNTQQSSADRSSHQLNQLFEQKLNISENLGRESASSPREQYRNQISPATNNVVEANISQLFHYSNQVPLNDHPPKSQPLQPHRDDFLVRLLIQNDIAPSSLRQSQLKLFEQSTPDQRQRLIMLWRLAPPVIRNVGQVSPAPAMEPETTTLELEV